MKIIPEVNDIVVVKQFNFTNIHGGTGISEGQKMKCKITKAWYDYECGWRYWAEPLEEIDPTFFVYDGDYNNDNIIYVSQFDVIEIRATYTLKDGKVYEVIGLQDTMTKQEKEDIREMEKSGVI